MVLPRLGKAFSVNRLPEFRWEHTDFFLENPAHIFRICVSRQLRDLIKLQPGPCQQSFDSFYSQSSDRFSKSHSSLFLKLCAQIFF